MYPVILLAILAVLLILTIFNKGFIFSAAVFFVLIGIMIYVDAKYTQDGKAWFMLGIGLASAWALLRVIMGISRGIRGKID